MFWNKISTMLLIAPSRGDLSDVTLLLVLKTTFVPNFMTNGYLTKLQEKLPQNGYSAPLR